MKKILISLWIVCLLAGLTACGQPAVETPPDTTAATQESTEPFDWGSRLNAGNGSGCAMGEVSAE